MPTILRSRAYAARRIAGVYRKYRARRAMGRYVRKGRYIRRAVGVGNPVPTFVETFRKTDDDVLVPAGNGVGKVFKLRISDMPQWQQYLSLYKQYRINWVKVMLIPNFDGTSFDINSAAYNNSTAGYGGWQGMARIAYAINDSPDVTAPVNEDEVLTDNGCKIKAFKSKWSCSFKPVPDVKQTTSVGTIWTRQKFRQWFNFDPLTIGNNPEHGAVSAFISLPGNIATPANPSMISDAMRYHCYYKVSFTLRDPQ